MFRTLNSSSKITIEKVIEHISSHRNISFNPGINMQRLKWDEEELQIVMELLSKCKSDCNVEVDCFECLYERLSIRRAKQNAQDRMSIPNRARA
jgi:hypothetical protein